MFRNTLLAIITFALLTGSCAGRKNKVDHKDNIPEKDLVSILTEVHIADGLLTLPEINYLFSDRDTLSSYIDIIEKYGYTKETMDRTIRYYFIKQPKKLIRIYDKVLGTLSEMEARVDRDIPPLRAYVENLWKDNSSYYIPSPDVADTEWFDLKISFPGTYTLKYNLTIYPDDETSSPRSGIFLSTSDSVKYEEREYLTVLPYIKDGLPHTYDAILTLNTSGPVWVMGWFIDHENQSPFLQRHYRLDNIMLKRGLIE